MGFVCPLLLPGGERRGVDRGRLHVRRRGRRLCGLRAVARTEGSLDPVDPLNLGGPVEKTDEEREEENLEDLRKQIEEDRARRVADHDPEEFPKAKRPPPLETSHQEARDGMLRELERALKQRKNNQANDIYHAMHSSMLIESVVTFNRVLHLFGRYYSPKRARSIFKDLTGSFNPTVVSFNTLMDSYAKKRDVIVVEKILGEMVQAGVRPNRVSYSIRLGVHASVGHIDKVTEILNEMKQESIELNVITMTSAMRAFASNGNTRAVVRMFTEMEDEGIRPDRITYSVLIDALGKDGLLGEADSAFQEMLDNKIFPDYVLITTMMKAHLNRGNLEQVRRYFAFAEELEVEVNDVPLSILVEAAGKEGGVEEAEKVYLEAQAALAIPTCGLVRALMKVYADHGDLRGIRKCFQIRKKLKLPFEARDFSLLFNGCSCSTSTSAWSLAKVGWAEMERLRIRPPVATVNAILRCCVELGSYREFQSYFKEFERFRMRPSLISFGLTVKMLTAAGRLDDDHVQELFADIKRAGLTPDAALFNNLIKIYADSGDLVRVERMRIALEEAGLKPDSYTQATLIDCYTTNGELDLAEEVYLTINRDATQRPSALKLAEMKLHAERGEQDLSASLFQTMNGNASTFTRRKAAQLWVVACGKSQSWNALRRAEAAAIPLLDAQLGNTLVTSYLRAQAPVDAMRIVKTAVHFGVPLSYMSFSVLISGLHRLNQKHQAELYRVAAARLGLCIYT